MKSSVGSREGNKITLSVEVEPDEFATDMDAMFAKLSKEVKLPGFRKGKAPRSVLEARLGKDYARQRTIEESLPKYATLAILECEVDAIATPEVDITSDETDKSVRFDMVVEVRPEINLAGYGSLRVEVPHPEPTDAEITEEIDRFRANFGTLEAVARPAGEKDRVTVDLRATYNGETFDPYEATDFVYEIGSGTTGFQDFDKNLTGSQAGQIFDLNVPHPEEEGQIVRIKTLVKDVQENKLPDFDDNFAKESSEFETAEELRADFASKVALQKRVEVARLFTQKTEESLNQLVEETLSEALLNQATQEAARSLMMRLQSVGLDLERYLQITRQTPESFTAAMQVEGERQAKLDLALRAVVTAENLEMSDEEIYEYIREAEAEHEERTGHKHERSQTDEPIAQSLRIELLKREAFKWVCENAEIVDPEGKSIAYDEIFIEAEEETAEQQLDEQPEDQTADQPDE